MWIAVVLFALVLSGALQLGVLKGFGPRRPIGDEVEYLERARGADPYGPVPFLRLPGFIFLNRCLGLESRIRGTLALIAGLSAVLVAIAAWKAGGGPVALLAVLFLLLPERLIHACHIWPDTVLGAVMAAVLIALQAPEAAGLPSILALGILGMIGTMTRIDFLPVAPASGLALVLGGAALDHLCWLLLIAPTILALAVWTWRNWLRYRRAMFEDTWAFNAMVAAELAANRAQQEPAIELPIAEVHRKWAELRGRQRAGVALDAVGAMLRRPLGAVQAIGRRLLAYVGPESFILRSMLPAASAYSTIPQNTARRLAPFLRLGFPSLLVLGLLGSLLSREAPPSYLWPAASVALLSVLVHTRTRYRIVVLPAMALWAAEAGVRSTFLLAREPVGLLVLALAAASGWALWLGRAEDGSDLIRANLRESEARSAKLEERLAGLSAKIEQLEAERDPDTRTIGDLETQLEERLESERRLEAELDWKSRQLLELQAELDRRSQWIEKLEVDSDSNSQEIIALQGRIEARAEHVRRLEADVESNRVRILELEVERDSNRDTIRDLERDLARLREKLRLVEEPDQSRALS